MPHSDPAPRALRLELALDAGLVLPGTVLALAPRAGESLAPLPADRLRIATPHFPDHAAFTAQGYPCTRAPEGPAEAVLVCLPRARAEARDLIAQACALTSGPVIIDGQKTDGVDSVLRDLRAVVTVDGPISKGHGKIFWFPSPGASTLEHWRDSANRVLDEAGRSFTTRAGLFSADGVDPGSALLAATLPETLSGTVVDLGAGWGYLSARLLDLAPKVRELHLIEADSRALDCARDNVTDPRAVFHWADATAPLPGVQADAVIMNPPFHIGRAGQPGLGIAFIRAAAALLRPSGKLWLVANRHLPYEAALSASFRSHAEVSGTPAFKVLLAEGPVRATRPAQPQGRRRPGHGRGGRD